MTRASPATDLPLRVFGLLGVGRHGHHKKVLQDESGLESKKRGLDSATVPSACGVAVLHEGAVTF